MRIGGRVRICIGTMFSLNKLKSIYSNASSVIAAAHGLTFTITPIL